MVIYHLPNLNMYELLKIAKIINENIKYPFNIYYLLSKDCDKLIEFIDFYCETYKLFTKYLLSFSTLTYKKFNNNKEFDNKEFDNKKSRRKKSRHKKSRHKKSKHKKFKCKNLIVV